MKELVGEFKKQCTCLGKNTEKCRTFTVPIKKEVARIDKNGEEITKIYLAYYCKFESARFMTSSL